jgi:hypothetical protein
MRRLYLLLVVLAAVLLGARAAMASVCPITLPAHASALTVAVELPEQILARRCQAGDVLSISGDLHAHSLARVCDLARAVVLHPVAPATGRPSGAMCTYVGGIRAEREPPPDPPHAALQPDPKDAAPVAAPPRRR